jgi:hypothetical protein
MKLILNIGLDVISHKVVQSDTEPTLVVEAIVADNFSLEHGCYQTADNFSLEHGCYQTADNFSLEHGCYQTAVELRQDCIAFYVPLWRYGQLVGPRAAAWGEFNPEFFILPSGKRLAQPSKAV